MEKAFYVLAMDTALQGCSVAVVDVQTGARTIKSEAMGRGQSERLVPMVEEAMKDAGIDYPALNLVAVTVGPGAFTGLRIGLSAARTFATALDIPVIGITTTETVAARYAADRGNKKNTPFAVILDSKRCDYYVQFFDEDGKPTTTPSARTADDIADEIDAYMRGAGPSPIGLTGNGVARFMGEVGHKYKGQAVTGYDLPDPGIVADLGLTQFRTGVHTPATPLYLREADVSKPKHPRRIVVKKP